MAVGAWNEPTTYISRTGAPHRSASALTLSNFLRSRPGGLGREIFLTTFLETSDPALSNGENRLPKPAFRRYRRSNMAVPGTRFLSNRGAQTWPSEPGTSDF